MYQKIYGIAMCKDEADIIVQSLEHYLFNGIEKIFIADHMSSDGTRQLVEQTAEKYPGRIHIYNNTDFYFLQPQWMTRLANEAGHAGAEWIIPFDIDEFWYAPDYDTIAEALNNIGPECSKVTAPMYRYYGWDYREPNAKPWPKIAFRWERGARLANGNHDVHLPSYNGNIGMEWLRLGELQYRSCEHFIAKIRKQFKTIDPEWGYGEATHIRIFGAMSDEELTDEWQKMIQAATVMDPLPIKRAEESLGGN